MVFRRALIALAAVTLAFPGPLLLYGPLTLGFAHLASDICYLPSLLEKTRRRLVWMFIAAWVLLALLQIWRLARKETLIFNGAEFAICAGLVSLILASSSQSRIALLGWCAAGIGFVIAPRTTAGLFALGHHFAAIAIWQRLAPVWNARFWHWFVGLSLGCGFIVGYLFLMFPGSLVFSGVTAIGQALAPWSQGEVFAASVAGFYLFGQLVHYWIWLSKIPETQIDKPGSNYRSLFFGLTIASFAACIGLLYLKADLPSLRYGYLVVAGFHSYLELAVLTLAMSLDRMPAPTTSQELL